MIIKNKKVGWKCDDVKKYEKIYEEIKCLEPEDTLQLTLEADSEEQREFYQMVGDFCFKKKQKTGNCEEFILNEKIYLFWVELMERVNSTTLSDIR